MEIFPIFIPSKGRAGASKTIEQLLAHGQEIRVVVEPQDEESYKAAYPGSILTILPENNKGISFVRNWILEHCRNVGIEWYWMLDDDISNFYHREGTKMLKDDYTVLIKAQEIFTKIPKIAQASLEYQQIAWSASKDYTLNSYQDVCVCINSKRTGNIIYREYVNLKEDRDFTMQIIKSGFDTCRVSLYAFAAPKNGSNKGGLKEVYDTEGREKICSERMIELWGDSICRLNIKEDGRPDTKIMWKEIRKTQTSLF